WWCSDTAELFFDDCRVPVTNLIGEEGEGFALLAENFQMERLALAVMANVTAELALDECQRWVGERRAFGRSIGKFQVIRHRLAEMATLVEASRQMTYRQAARVQAGQVAVKEISMAKNFATDAADRVTWDAVQIFGGSGYMRGSLVERLYRDARVLSIGGGTREIMNEVICRQMGL
ncbi:MAG TPA: acyl-CoA dehydrogenase family protein, partial [Anaeromyxobacteraceae bacterium]|nr:acyl-CoA dehydrogenase family protein [Anaeromyxobacteraceae bacterium]